jgi:hypothetical protein
MNDTSKQSGGNCTSASDDNAQDEQYSAFQQGDSDAGFDENSDKGIMLGDLTAGEGAYFRWVV